MLKSKANSMAKASFHLPCTEIKCQNVYALDVLVHTDDEETDVHLLIAGNDSVSIL